MKKILFLIHDLGVGGAEKVLVNLVNHLDPEKFSVTVIALFGGGVNEQFLKKTVRYRSIFSRTFPGNSHIMKLFSPGMLHRLFIKEKYDIEVAYLEGPSARIISGCPHQDTKLISWIHIEQHTPEVAAGAFRNFSESQKCYSRFDEIVCVSEYVKNDFLSIYPDIRNVRVLYNTNETSQIIKQKDDPVEEDLFREGELKVCFVGKVVKSKGIDRVARIFLRLRNEEIPVHFYILGIGPEQEHIETEIKAHEQSEYFTFLGYQNNPYKYVSRCDVFICASHSEGFSTAATEALVVGTPVVTVDVSGMKEMLGENNEYGIVTEQNEEALYDGLKKILKSPELLTEYKRKAKGRGKLFDAEQTVQAVEQLLINMK